MGVLEQHRRLVRNGLEDPEMSVYLRPGEGAIDKETRRDLRKVDKKLRREKKRLRDLESTMKIYSEAKNEETIVQG